MFYHKDKIPPTLTRRDRTILFDEYRGLNNIESCKIGSYPMDYNFLKNNPTYLIGMSVPPLMMAQIADRIFNQWLNKI